MPAACARYALILLALGCSTAGAVDFGPRPCGPDQLQGPLRYLVPQEVAGADFRPACRKHDLCYEVPGADRSACDRQYLEDMQGACAASRRPRCCRTVARLMYVTTRIAGQDAFDLSQWIALRGGR